MADPSNVQPEPPRTPVSNCLFFALARLMRRGGFLVARKSEHGWWPHFLWSPDLRVFEEYQPAKPNDHLLFPPPIYRGVVRTFRPQ